MKTAAAPCARSAWAQGAAVSVGPAGTRAGARIGRDLSGLLGERLFSEPRPPKSVCAEIHRPRVPACAGASALACGLTLAWCLLLVSRNTGNVRLTIGVGDEPLK